MEAKNLNYKEIEGFLSERQLSEHHDVLYAGYVKKVGEIREKLNSTDKADANGTYANYRELKIEEGFALNGVNLHELYFENMGGKNTAPSSTLLEIINADFGSLDEFLKDLTAAGMSARGWVVTAIDSSDGKLRNFICDMHNQGGVWGLKPILVLDVYEHAYFLDYGTKRAVYIEKFIENIDWEVVDKRIEN